MKTYSGYKPEAASVSYPMLPKGAYVCSIQNVKVTGEEPDQQLTLQLEIIEGEWAGYYTKRYKMESGNTQSRFPAKYKGTLSLQWPDERNTKRQHFDWDVRTMNGAIYAIEQSNPGFTFDAEHPEQLKGKIVGLSVQYGEYNGNPYTRPRRLEVADEVRAGTVKPVKDAEPSGSVAETANSGFTPVEVDEIPF